jgi:hypothetical protein
MSGALYFYLPHHPSHLNELVTAHQERFEQIIKDNFDDEELSHLENLLESIAAINVQPILSELSFDDLYPDPGEEGEQRAFFNHCKSCLCFENLPFLESHPFQVSYLKELLGLFEEVLIDRGGVKELMFKQAFLGELMNFKSIEQLFGPTIARQKMVKSFLPVDPIDFLVLDVYKEIDRLRRLEKLPDWQNIEEEKIKKLIYLMGKEVMDPATLYVKSGLNAKDFDDYLEKMKFWLKAIS